MPLPKQRKKAKQAEARATTRVEDNVKVPEEEGAGPVAGPPQKLRSSWASSICGCCFLFMATLVLIIAIRIQIELLRMGQGSVSPEIWREEDATCDWTPFDPEALRRSELLTRAALDTDGCAAAAEEMDRAWSRESLKSAVLRLCGQRGGLPPATQKGERLVFITRNGENQGVWLRYQGHRGGGCARSLAEAAFRGSP